MKTGISRGWFRVIIAAAVIWTTPVLACAAYLAFSTPTPSEIRWSNLTRACTDTTVSPTINYALLSDKHTDELLAQLAKKDDADSMWTAKILSDCKYEKTRDTAGIFWRRILGGAVITCAVIVVPVGVLFGLAFLISWVAAGFRKPEL